MNGGAGIGGITREEGTAPSHWASYLSVPEVDASYKRALSNGANSSLPPMDFGPVGRAASVADPTGAAVMLWKGAQGDRPDAEPTPVGDWTWCELHTSDTASALAFYENTFDFSHDTMDMGPMRTYYSLEGPDGKMRGGLMKGNHFPRCATHGYPMCRWRIATPARPWRSA